jgi:uncharacterized peroxidase-related enzyme
MARGLSIPTAECIVPFLPSLPPDAGVRHLITINRSAGRALIELHAAALRNESDLAARDKELIAAYVSALNACQYCFGVHAETAGAFGIEAGLLEALLADPEAAPVEPRLKPLLDYARKLTLAPARVTQADADAVFRAGWREPEFHDAVLTICLFNFMNRLVDGHGVRGSPALFSARGKALHEEGYAPLLALLDSGSAS